MGRMFEVTAILRDKDDYITKVRAKELQYGKVTEEEKTYTSVFICNGAGLEIPDQSSHSFFVRSPSGKGDVIINCEEKNEKVCLVALEGGVNLLENYPVYY
jgi:hypothetical protein